MYLAYKFVVITVLVAEANFCTERLSLPVNRPITENKLSYKFVTPPDILSLGGAGGRVDFGQYSFSEGHHPHFFINKNDPFGDLSAAEQNEMLSHKKSLINTNEAYQLATNWLASVDVDVSKLEQTSKWEVRQRWCFGDNGAKILLPVFYVRWGEWNEAKVEISVDGRNKDLLELRMMNHGAFSRHPTELVKNLDKLLAISDDEFRKYSPLERSNLIARFAVNWPFTMTSTVTNQSLMASQTNSFATTNSPTTHE